VAGAAGGDGSHDGADSADYRHRIGGEPHGDQRLGDGFDQFFEWVAKMLKHYDSCSIYGKAAYGTAESLRCFVCRSQS